MKNRKINHLDVSLSPDSLSKLSNGFEDYIFKYNALPEINFDDIDTSTAFLGKTVSIPVMISSITGGVTESIAINQRLAEFAQHYSIAMCLGSARILMSDNNLINNGFDVRKLAPDILLFANLGAIQLNNGITIDDCKKIVELTEADALVLHLNPMQEVFQTSGNTNFEGLLRNIESLCASITIPIIVKEVGFGISKHTAKQLINAGITALDIAGSGGTDWIKMEAILSNNNILKDIAKEFDHLGIPTAKSLFDVRNYNIKKIASGGILNGIEIAKAIALGADLAGIARGFLANINHLDEYYLKLLKSLQITMFSIGAKTISELKNTEQLKKI